MLAFAVTLVAIWPLRRLALRFKFVDHPGPRKAHSAPTPYLGGGALLLGLVTSIWLFRPGLLQMVVLLGLVTALGLYDDVWHAAVSTKLLIEGSVALAAVMLGFSWHVTDSAILNGGISIVWLVGLTNSFNLLDNMDGLSSTIATVALVGIALLKPATAELALPLAACLVAFLVVNLPPARMFLGDAGSLTVGFAVGLMTITAANSAHGLHSLLLLTLPVALALFDTSLVVVSRLRARLPIQLGGRDHFSHRLRQLGLSERQVLAIALVAAGFGVFAAYLAGQYPLPVAWLGLPIGVLMFLGWVRLLAVNPYQRRDARPEVLHG